MYFNSPDNLPDSEKKYEYLHSKERLEHLCRIINGRPVAILAAGPSIIGLEKRLDELSQTDICYFGMNSFFVQENQILKRISKHFSVITTGLNEGLKLTFNSIKLFNKVINFLDRNDDNLFISSFYANRVDLLGPSFNLLEFLEKYDRKLLFPNYSTDKNVPNVNYPMNFLTGNSLAGLIYMAIIGKASKIILFGADGYTIDKDPYRAYYRSEEYLSETFKRKAKYKDKIIIMLKGDTNQRFNPLVPISLRNIYKTYDIKPVPILNCSTVSFYTPFPVVSYDDVFAFLLGKKNVEEIADLRIPTASIIIPHSGDEKKLQDTLKSIAEQIYSNHETIVIQTKSGSFFEEIKKALSSAKGKYVFYCPPSNTYSDENWLNSSIEILENQPEISLVCGLSQFTDPPWPKEKFIYYWLKKKGFFPVNMLCVRKKVLEKCLLPPEDRSETDTEFAFWLDFNYQFNTNGYLPAFIPTAAGNHRHSIVDRYLLDIYKNKIDRYKKYLVLKKEDHRFRNSDGNILPGKFSLITFLLYNPTKKIEAKLLCPLYPHLNTVKQIVRNTAKLIVMGLLKLTPPAIERKTINLYQSLKKRRGLR